MTYGIIYQYTNTLSGLIYVGQTIEPARRRRTYVNQVASGIPNPRLIIQAMRHAGLESFTYQVLAEASTKDELNRLEIHYIAMLQANNPQYGYNRTVGGEGGPVGLIVSAETKAKIAQTLRGKTHSAETRAKMSRTHRGHTVSAETRAKISLAARAMSDETRAKLSLARRLRIVSAETRAKMSQAKRAMSDETKAKMSLAQRGRTLSAETKAKISLARRLRIVSAETKKNPLVTNACVKEGSERDG